MAISKEELEVLAKISSTKSQFKVMDVMTALEQSYQTSAQRIMFWEALGLVKKIPATTGRNYNVYLPRKQKIEEKMAELSDDNTTE